MNEFIAVQEDDLTQVDGGWFPALVALVGGGLIVYGTGQIINDALGGRGLSAADKQMIAGRVANAVAGRPQ